MVLMLTISVGALAIGNEKTAIPSQTKFVMDGKEVTFDMAYNIEDSNYIQLRSVAQTLNGTKSQFNVYWDDVLKQAVIETGAPYTGVKPVVVEKDVYKVGEIVLMKNAEVTITDVFTTETRPGGILSQPGETFYGVSFTILSAASPYSNIELHIRAFIGGIVTTKGERISDFGQATSTKIYPDQVATGTIYYTIKKDDVVASILLQDLYGNSKTVSVS